MSELTKIPKVLITVLSHAERDGWHHPSITDFLYGLRWEDRYSTNYAPMSCFSPAASGRNVISKHFMDSEAEILMMIDNDMVVPPNIIDTLKDAPPDWGILAPIYYMWDGSRPSVTLCWGVQQGSKGHKVVGEKEYYDISPGFHPLTKSGTGIMFVRKEAFAAVEYPYFRYRYNEHGMMIGTEDIYFCDMAREKGIKIYGNSAIRVGHMHQVNLLTMADMIYNGLGIDDAQRPVDSRKPNGVSSPAEMAASVPPASQVECPSTA
jgi:hypothetical protein